MSCVLAVPGVTTGGFGRLRSWISHLVSTWASNRLGLAVIMATDKSRGRLVFMVRTSAPMREDSSSDLFLNTELLWERRPQSEGAI